MIIIFWLSSRTAYESSEQSNAVLEWLTRIFGDNIFTVFIVRKGAHCLEFTGLSLLLCGAFYFQKGRKNVFPAVALTSLYAVTDELHQLFVDGRSCEFRDWLIDTGGAAVGALGFIVLLFIIGKICKKITKKKNKNIDTQII